MFRMTADVGDEGREDGGAASGGDLLLLRTPGLWPGVFRPLRPLAGSRVASLPLRTWTKPLGDPPRCGRSYIEMYDWLWHNNVGNRRIERGNQKVF